MKLNLSIVILFLLNINICKSQLLPTPIITQVPCILNPGFSDTIKINPIPTASGYVWGTTTNLSNLFINGQLSPVTSVIPQAGFTSFSPQTTFLIYVYATSSCCNSDTAWITISGNISLTFDQNNDTVVTQGSSSIYNVNQTCNLSSTSGIAQYVWSITGDAGINGTGNNSATTPGNTPFVNLNFGSNFITGELCVYAVTNFGLPTDTICMTINATTSIDEINESGLQAYYSNTDHNIVLQSTLLSNENTMSYYISDSKGGIVLSGEHIFKYKENLLIPFNSYPSGMYVVHISNGKKSSVAKFAVIQ